MTLFLKTGCECYTVRAASWQEDIQALRKIREAVFIREQGVPQNWNGHEFDVNCIHVLALNSALILSAQPDYYWMVYWTDGGADGIPGKYVGTALMLSC